MFSHSQFTFKIGYNKCLVIILRSSFKLNIGNAKWDFMQRIICKNVKYEILYDHCIKNNKF